MTPIDWNSAVNLGIEFGGWVFSYLLGCGSGWLLYRAALRLVLREVVREHLDGQLSAINGHLFRIHNDIRNQAETIERIDLAI